MGQRQQRRLLPWKSWICSFPTGRSRRPPGGRPRSPPVARASRRSGGRRREFTVPRRNLGSADQTPITIRRFRHVAPKAEGVTSMLPIGTERAGGRVRQRVITLAKSARADRVVPTLPPNLLTPFEVRPDRVGGHSLRRGRGRRWIFAWGFALAVAAAWLTRSPSEATSFEAEVPPPPLSPSSESPSHPVASAQPSGDSSHPADSTAGPTFPAVESSWSAPLRGAVELPAIAPPFPMPASRADPFTPIR
jgi:hypothetical protein